MTKLSSINNQRDRLRQNKQYGLLSSELCYIFLNIVKIVNRCRYVWGDNEARR